MSEIYNIFHFYLSKKLSDAGKPINNIKTLVYSMQSSKKSPRYYAHHVQDKYTDLGFDYRNNIFKKSVSPVIYNNRINEMILKHIGNIIAWMIDTVKQIKLQYMVSLPKNSRNLN